MFSLRRRRKDPQADEMDLSSGSLRRCWETPFLESRPPFDETPCFSTLLTYQTLASVSKTAASRKMLVRSSRKRVSQHLPKDLFFPASTASNFRQSINGKRPFFVSAGLHRSTRRLRLFEGFAYENTATPLKMRERMFCCF
jgi:hypothetical protein